jgi:hypothetical protein
LKLPADFDSQMIRRKARQCEQSKKMQYEEEQVSEVLSDIERELDDEIARRLAIMENPSYEYPPSATRGDWMAIIAIVTVSFCLLVYGILFA